MENVTMDSTPTVENQAQPTAPITPTATEPTDTGITEPALEGGSDDTVTDAWDEDFVLDGDAPIEGEVTSPKEVADVPVDMDGLYSSQMENTDAELDKPVFIKLNGKVTEIKNINDMKDLMERGLGATRKYQEMAEDRKVIDFMNSNGISMEALNQLVTSRGEVPIEPIQNTQQDMQIQQVVDKISSSAYVEDFKSGVSFLPNDVKETIANSPELLDGLYGDFESGLAQKVLPIVERTMAIKGLNFVQAYTQAVQSLPGGSTVAKQTVNPLAAEPRGNVLGVKVDKPKSVWDMDSTEFKKYM